MKNIELAYAIWPWGKKTSEMIEQAMKDIKEVGFNAFETVESIVNVFGDCVEKFKELISIYNVRPVSLYFWHNGDEAHDIGNVERKMDFMAELGIKRMSVQAPTNNGKPSTKDELIKLLGIINKIGETTKQYGVVPCIHPHHGTQIMYENEIDFIMQNTDPEYVSFGPDTAHLLVGGCNPVKIFENYSDRIKFVHLKDFKCKSDVKLSDGESEGYDIYSNFLEIGNGDVDFKSIFNILKKIDYEGYLTVELDKSRYTNKKSAQISMDYLKRTALF